MSGEDHLTEIAEGGLKTLFDGDRYYEGPRWHDGKLWFVDCMTRKLLSLTLARDCIEHASFADDIPCGLGVLPDGRIVALTMARKRLFTFAGGRLSLYADLSDVAAGTIDDMIVDGKGLRLCRRSRFQHASAARSRRGGSHHPGEA
jgi:sugar lactone lactonase YvrE